MLPDILGERLSTAEAVRLQHTHTINWIPPQLPDAVVFLMSTEEVARIFSICAEHRVANLFRHPANIIAAALSASRAQAFQAWCEVTSAAMPDLMLLKGWTCLKPLS